MVDENPVQFREDYQLLLGPFAEFLALMHRTFQPLMAFGEDLLPKAREAAARLEPLAGLIERLEARRATAEQYALDAEAHATQATAHFEEIDRACTQLEAERNATSAQRLNDLEKDYETRHVEYEQTEANLRSAVAAVAEEWETARRLAQERHAEILAGMAAEEAAVEKSLRRAQARLRSLRQSLMQAAEEHTQE